MARPLDGIRVLDLTRVLAGPYCTLLLGQLGAEIIKIENPGTGDDAREYLPMRNGDSIYFLAVNLEKKSLTLNLKHPEARKIVHELAAVCDIAVENFRPGTTAKLGIDYETLSRINPRLVYASLSGFGQTGPYSQLPGYDLVIQGMSGLMSITGTEGGAPMKSGLSTVDVTTGMYGAVYILAALRHRDQTGEGQWIDLSMFDAMLSLQSTNFTGCLNTGKVPGPVGNRHPNITPFSSFHASDGDFIIAIGNDKMWQSFCKIVNRPDLAQDPRFTTNESRTIHWKDLEKLMNEITVTRGIGDWIIFLRENGIPAGPINTYDRVEKHKQIEAREMIRKIHHPTLGDVRVPGVPAKFSKTPSDVAGPSPLLGQHTDDILKNLLGRSDADIARLRKDKTI